MFELSNPTAQLDLSFAAYVADRERTFAERTVRGIPDYAFALDQDLRKKIAAVRPLRDLAQAVTALAAPLARNTYLLKGVAVSPNNYREIYQMGEECARRLGIGLPQIFVYHAPVLNAFAIATDDIEPVIILTSATVEALTPDELRFVIGHEAGHIHNLHSVYNTAAEMLTNPLLQTMFEQLAKAGAALKLIQTFGQIELLYKALQGAMHLFFMHWSRCAEITCDRAGLICCGDLRASQHALARIQIGDIKYEGFNIEEFVQQLSRTSTPLRFYDELMSTHPIIPRRIAALRHFAESETYFGWRPEARGTAAARSAAEVDRTCVELLNVFTKGGVKA